MNPICTSTLENFIYNAEIKYYSISKTKYFLLWHICCSSIFFHLPRNFDAAAKVLILLMSLTKEVPRDHQDFTTCKKYMLVYNLLDIINTKESAVIVKCCCYSKPFQEKINLHPCLLDGDLLCLSFLNTDNLLTLPKTPGSSRDRTDCMSVPYPAKLTQLF